MTANVQKVLNKIKNSSIFDEELYFVGGTALSYYLNHRISEDIDIVSASSLNHRVIILQMLQLGAVQVKDANITALRMAGLFPEEYMLKFILYGVKIEFFQANRSIQKEILSGATFEYFEDSKLKILDLKSISKLKIVALVMRKKSRDLFDFGSILKYGVFSTNELIDLFLKIDKNINSMEAIIEFIISKKELKDDEAVYLSETEKINFTFTEIKEKVIRYCKEAKSLKHF